MVLRMGLHPPSRGGNSLILQLLIYISTGKNNINYIMNFLNKIPYQRNHRLGVELGVSLPTLNLIEVDFHGNSERIRMEIVQNWLYGNANQDISMRFLQKVADTLGK